MSFNEHDGSVLSGSVSKCTKLLKKWLKSYNFKDTIEAYTA